jgi:hypothetical protein
MNAEALFFDLLQKWPVCVQNVLILSMAIRTVLIFLKTGNARNACGMAAAVHIFFH